MACFQHNFRRCTGKEQSCAICCAQEAECQAFYYEPVTGAQNNLQVGDKVWLTSECSGEAAPDGYYTDCTASGSCDQPDGETRIYGCVTVASGAVSAIAACSGDVSCGSGAGDLPSSCSQSSTLETDIQHRWQGRQKIKVSTLDTWETLYKAPTRWNMKNTTGTVCVEDSGVGVIGYLKQIYIHNCDKGSTNEKKFSVRIYNSTTGTQEVSDCNLVSTVVPAEMTLADRIKLDDNQRIKLLEHESPLKLYQGDKIDIQAHTSKDGWTISAWVEGASQNYEETVDQFNINEDYGKPNAVANMSGLSKKLNQQKANKRFKPGA